MNQLALAPENVLVTPAFLVENAFQVGDRFNLRVAVNGYMSYEGVFRIAGLYDYFPTVMPGEMAIIGNLDYLSTQAGAEFPHLIWLRLASGSDHDKLLQAVNGKGITAGNPQDALALLAAAQAKMERVGIFGTLSVGFVAATLMAILAFLVHSYAALQERLYQFGVLRALGLRQRQVLGGVALEYTVLTIYGAALGGLIGMATVSQFAPLFRIPDNAGAPPPPLIPLVQQEATIHFALAFAILMVLTQIALMSYALRHRLFDALRVGSRE